MDVIFRADEYSVKSLILERFATALYLVEAGSTMHTRGDRTLRMVDQQYACNRQVLGLAKKPLSLQTLANRAIQCQLRKVKRNSDPKRSYLEVQRDFLDHFRGSIPPSLRDLIQLKKLTVKARARAMWEEMRDMEARDSSLIRVINGN